LLLSLHGMDGDEWTSLDQNSLLHCMDSHKQSYLDDIVDKTSFLDDDSSEMIINNHATAQSLSSAYVVKNQARKVKCKICGKLLAAQLKRHMYSHTGETPFVCDLCGHGCSQSCNLKRHIAAHTRKSKAIHAIQKVKDTEQIPA